MERIPSAPDRRAAPKAGHSSVVPIRGDLRLITRDREAGIDLNALFAENVQRELRKPTIGERLVRFFREMSAGVGWSLYVLGVLVACYFAFQLGRGL